MEICGDELLPGNHALNGSRDKMAVGARSPEGRLVDTVFSRQGAHLRRGHYSEPLPGRDQSRRGEAGGTDGRKDAVVSHLGGPILSALSSPGRRDGPVPLSNRTG